MAAEHLRFPFPPWFMFPQVQPFKADVFKTECPGGWLKTIFESVATSGLEDLQHFKGGSTLDGTTNGLVLITGEDLSLTYCTDRHAPEVILPRRTLQ